MRGSAQEVFCQVVLNEFAEGGTDERALWSATGAGPVNWTQPMQKQVEMNPVYCCVMRLGETSQYICCVPQVVGALCGTVVGRHGILDLGGLGCGGMQCYRIPCYFGAQPVSARFDYPEAEGFGKALVADRHEGVPCLDMHTFCETSHRLMKNSF